MQQAPAALSDKIKQVYPRKIVYPVLSWEPPGQRDPRVQVVPRVRPEPRVRLGPRVRSDPRETPELRDPRVRAEAWEYPVLPGVPEPRVLQESPVRRELQE